MGMIGDLYIRLGLKNEDFKTKIHESNSILDDFKSQIGKVGAAIAAAFTIESIEKFVKSSVEAFDREAQSSAKLDAVLRSTGNAAGVFRSDLDDLTDSMIKHSIYSQVDVQNAETLMLTFTRVSRSIFPEAIKAATDMATVMGGDLQGTIIQVGKALNDPITGLNSLRRMGVTFSADQKKLISSLIESNDGLGAQKIILQELEREFGTAAEAVANSGIGKLHQFKNEWEEFKASLGEFVVDKSGFTGWIEWMSSTLRSFESDTLSGMQKLGIFTQKFFVDPIAWATGLNHIKGYGSIMYDPAAEQQNTSNYWEKKAQAAVGKAPVVPGVGAKDYKTKLSEAKSYYLNMYKAADDNYLKPYKKELKDLENMSWWDRYAKGGDDKIMSMQARVKDVQKYLTTISNSYKALDKTTTFDKPKPPKAKKQPLYTSTTFTGAIAELTDKINQAQDIINNLNSTPQAIDRAIDILPKLKDELAQLQAVQDFRKAGKQMHIAYLESLSVTPNQLDEALGGKNMDVLVDSLTKSIMPDAKNSIIMQFNEFLSQLPEDFASMGRGSEKDAFSAFMGGDDTAKKFLETENKFKAFRENMANEVEQFSTDVIGTFAEGMGYFIESGKLPSNFGMDFLKKLGSFMEQIGAAFITFGIAQMAFHKALMGLFTGIGGPALVAAGAALVVAGGIIAGIADAASSSNNNTASSVSSGTAVSSFTAGSGATNSSTAHDYEVKFRIEGKDLVAVLDKYNRSNSRKR